MLFWLPLGIAIGLFTGWLFFPAPTAVTNWWAAHGWGKRTVKSP